MKYPIYTKPSNTFVTNKFSEVFVELLVITFYSSLYPYPLDDLLKERPETRSWDATLVRDCLGEGKKVTVDGTELRCDPVPPTKNDLRRFYKLHVALCFYWFIMSLWLGNVAAMKVL